MNNIANVKFEDDIGYAMLFTKWSLKLIGVWSSINRNSTRSDKLISMILHALCYGALFSMLISTGAHMMLIEKDLSMKIKLFGPVGFMLSATVKYFFLGFRSSSFKNCIEYMENDWKKVEEQDFRRIMLENAKFGRNLTLLCITFLYTGGIFYHTVLPLLSPHIVVNNITIRPLVFPGYEIFMNPQISPNYEIVFSLHCFIGFTSYNITISSCTLAAIFVAHSCGQLQIIMAHLDDLVEGKKNRHTTASYRMSVIVKHHAEVLRFSKEVEDSLSEICLMELVANTLIICLLEYYCMMEWENSDILAIFTYFALLISLTFNIFIFSYIGDILAKQSTQIGDVSYAANWYNLTGIEARGLILLIARSHYPTKLTAGKISDLTLTTFANVLKSSVAYLNILRTMTG